MLTDKLSIVMLNCRSINTSKLGEIKLMIYINKPDIVCFSETWIKKYEPKFIDYIPIWQHRNFSQGGGLGILVKRNLHYQIHKLTIYPQGLLEVQAIKLIMANNRHLSILNIYNPSKPITQNEFRHYF